MNGDNDPMPATDPIRRCGAKTRSGGSCAQPAMRGQVRCRMHGGASPQARRSAQARLAELVLPAIGELARVMRSRTASDRDRLKAAEAVLDRAGYGRRQYVEGRVSLEDARQYLSDRLDEVLGDLDDEAVDAELVVDDAPRAITDGSAT